MEKLIKPLYYIAISGFVVSLLIHIISLTGYNQNNSIPFIWIIHIFVFVVFIPGILKISRYDRIKQKNRKLIENVKNLTAGVPKIISIIALISFFYAIMNFMAFIVLSEGGGPNIIDGEYVLSNHGDIIRTLTEKEYFLFQANELRGFSGHWMLFYSISVLMLYPRKRIDKTETSSESKILTDNNF